MSDNEPPEPPEPRPDIEGLPPGVQWGLTVLGFVVLLAAVLRFPLRKSR